ncbi:MAG: chloride channel protein [Candidatus Altiarchaeales archaeon]|nr:MAG: chloride channel protein [Candidatus Altiarchaeales archaeon]
MPSNRWLLLIPPLLGGLLSGVLVYRFAPEAEGDGTDAAIDAFHYKEGNIRLRASITKLITSAITIGSGGSAGKEGPVAQIGGGFGSFLARLFKLNAKDTRIALAVGLGAGMGSIFKAPFGGAIFASEILYLMDFETEVIPPAFIASLVGYLITGYLTGWRHIFFATNLAGMSYKLYEPLTLFFFVLLGVVNGFVGVIYVKVFYQLRDFFKRIETVPDMLKPAIGGLLTGLMGVFFPQVLGSSYGWLQMAINGDFNYLSITVLILLPFLKILSTAFTVASGGSGGTFAPALVIGGSIGASIWLLAKELLPGYDVPVAAYVVVGMMSFFGGVGKVPIATILMVSEMTGEYELFTPSLLTTILCYLITGHYSIYESQVRSRVESPAHGASKIGSLSILYEHLLEENSSILKEVKASQIMIKAPVKLRCTDKVGSAINLTRKYPYRMYPVVDGENRFQGFIKVEDLIFLRGKALNIELAYLPIHRGVAVHPSEELGEVMRKMIEHEVDKVAVVDSENKLLGIITAKEILRHIAFKRQGRRET